MLDYVEDTSASSLTSSKSQVHEAYRAYSAQDLDDERDDGSTADETKQRFYGAVIGLVSNIVNGLLYIASLYMPWLEGLGISHNSRALLGTLGPGGMALSLLPLALLHSTIVGRPGDVLVTVISGMLQTIAPLLICLGAASELQESSLAPLLAISWLCMGAGTGGVFGHTAWVNGANYAFCPKKKRIAVAAMPLALGLGSFMWMGLYHVMGLGPEGTLMLQAGLSGSTCLMRVAWMHRMSVTPTGQSACQRLRNGFLAYWSDAATVTFFVAITLTVGSGGVYLGDDSNLIMTLLSNDDDPALKHILHEANTVFLLASTLGRVAVLFFSETGLTLLTLAAVINSAAYATLWQLPKGSVAMVEPAAGAIGFSFGLVWGSWPILIATYGPGGTGSFQINMGITFWAVLLGNILFPMARRGLFQLGSQRHYCEINEHGHFHGVDCYEDVFVGFTILSTLAILMSVSGTLLLRRRARKCLRARPLVFSLADQS